MEYNLKPIGINRYRLLQNKKELPAVLFLRPQLLSQVVEEQEALRQLADATALPGVINPVIGLPDIHSGFGLPIGGVMAADAQKGVISAGAVGMDINFGVRLLRTNLAKETFYSVNHGAGRVLSRKKAAQSISDKDLALALGGILVNTKRLRSLADEAPAAYKDIEEVIATLTEVGITLPLARFLPLAVVKGEGSEG